MSAYSGIDDGTTAATVAEHRPLLTGVLKDEWGFDGVVISDWVATKSVAGAAEGGLDLQMPGPGRPVGRRPARRRPRRRGRRGAARREGRCACCAWPSASAPSRASSRPAPSATASPTSTCAACCASWSRGRWSCSATTSTRCPSHPTTSPGSPCSGPTPFTRSCRAAARRSSVRTTCRRPRPRCARRSARSRSTSHPGAVSRLLPPSLDLAGRCTHARGARRRARRAARRRRRPCSTAADVTEWHGWLREVPGPAAALRIRTTVAPGRARPARGRRRHGRQAPRSRSAARCCRPATASSAPRSSSTPA